MAPFKGGFTGNLNKGKGTSEPFRGFTGGTENFKKKEETRSKYFDNRPDISDDRLRRRQAQADEYQAFKNDPTKTKAVEGATGLFQAATPGGKTLAQKQQELAFKYGPTFSEIASDVSYRGGKIIGALGEKAMSGSLGIFGIIKEVANYAADKASGAYNSLTDVQKEIADNPNRYTFAEQQEKVKQLRNFRNLESQAEKDALGLRLDALQEASAQDATGVPAIGGGGGFDEQPSDLFGTGLLSLPVPKTTIEFPTRDPVFPAEEIKQSALDRFSPEYLEQQKALLDELNESPQVAELLGPNAPGGGEEEFYVDPSKQRSKGYPFSNVQSYAASTIDDRSDLVYGTQFENPAMEEGGFKSLVLDDILEPKSSEGTQVTAYNNPVNLMDVGQAGTTGETYGKGFAVFPNAQAGILAAKNDLAIKTERYGGNVDEIIGEFSPRSDNPDSFDNYVNFVKQGVGDTVDPGEENELLRRVIRFENKPDIAQQYLAMVAEGGLMDKKMYGGIISSKK